MTKVFGTLYLTIVILLFSYIYRICSGKNQTKILHKPVTSESDKVTSKSIDIQKQGTISFKISGSKCKNDSLYVSDTIKEFNEKICDWGDGYSSVYQKGDTIKGHLYLNSGNYAVKMVCDSFLSNEENVTISCDPVDSSDFSIRFPNYLRICKDTLIRFAKSITLSFDAVDNKSVWLINGNRYEKDAKKTFNRYDRIKVKFIPGKTFNPCYCDSTITLTFAPL